MVADKVAKIGFSPTLKINARAKSLKAEGVDVIDFSVGEPDFSTPDNVKEAGIKAIEQDFTRYTPASGILALKEAIRKRTYEDYGLDYKNDEIIVSPGAKASLYFLCTALFNPGDECIIPSPYWVSYPEMVGLADAIPVMVDTEEENGFKITAEDLRSAVTYKTKALMLNNPSNPTGSVYTRDELEEIARVVLETDLFVIADEIYDKVMFDDFDFTTFAALGDPIRERTVVINGVSKAYAMTGWRIGHALGPKEIIQAMGKVQSHATSNPCSIAQKAAVEALGGPQFSVRRMAIEFQQRRNYILQKLKQIKGLTCYKPEGAFYVFPNVSAYFDREADGMRVRDAYSLAYYLLERANVAIVPGDAFGMPGYIRISYATSMENIEKGMERIVEALARLRAAPKEKVSMIMNTTTKIKGRVASEKDLTVDDREKLVRLSENNLEYDEYHEWNANINGVIVQLRTNSPHLVDFWIDNWYPAELESDLVPHGVIYAVKGVENHEPYAYYNSESKTAFFFNTAYYGMVRGWALGIAADVSERLFDVHSIRCSCVDMNGEGVLIIGPTGTGRSTLAYGLLENENVRLHSDDWIFTRYREDAAIADISERKFYMRTDLCETYPDLAAVFARSKTENVCEKREDCTNRTCSLRDNCPLQKNEQYCFYGYHNARAIVDPNWLVGPDQYVRRTRIKHVFIVKRDPVSPSFEDLESEQAVKLLETGRYQVTTPGAHGYGSFKNQPFYNPYLLVKARERMELQKTYFRRLFEVARPYAVNTGAESVDRCIARILRVVGGK
jgi:aspartate/methionine/tyrosine aminotransferase